MTDDTRKVMRYVLLQVDPAWRRQPAEDRVLQLKDVADLFTEPAFASVTTYSTVGLRADADICLWQVADGPEELQDVQSRLNASAIGPWLRVAHSYLAMTRKSQYLGGHKHAGQESEAPAGPVGKPYLFVYPMDKQRPWYRLPFDERRRIMGEHFRVGHKYPGVTIHTGYSFGLDDQEFVVAFEGDSLGEFLDLVMELRESESSSYTLRDTPIFTCVRMPIGRVLEQLG